MGSGNGDDGVRETLVEEFVRASASDPGKARKMLRRMNAMEYLVALDRIRVATRPFPEWVRRG